MENKKLKILSAKVISNKMDKSATVAVERLVKHPVKASILKEQVNFISMMRIMPARLVKWLKLHNLSQYQKLNHGFW